MAAKHPVPGVGTLVMYACHAEEFLKTGGDCEPNDGTKMEGEAKRNMIANIPEAVRAIRLDLFLK